MKLKTSTLLIATIVLLLSSFSLKAQMESPIDLEYERPPIYIGPTIGYNRSLHSVELKSFADDALCPVFNNGSSSGFWIGLTWEQPLGEVKNSNSSIIVRGLYSTLPASLEVSGFRYPSLVSQYNAQGQVISNEVIYSSTVHTNEVNYSVVSLEVAYKLNPISGMNLGFTLGPTFDFALTKTQDQQFNLVEPLNASFDPTQNPQYQYTNANRTIVVADGDIPESSAFRLGIKAGIQYEIILKNRAYVVPAIYYNFGATNLTTQEDCRANALQVGVDIRFAL